MSGEKLLTADLFLQWFSKTLNLRFLNYDGLHFTALGLFLLSRFKNNNQTLLVLLEDDASARALYEFCCCFDPGFVYYFPKTHKAISHIQGFVPEYKRYQTESYYALSIKKPRLFISSLSGVHEKLFPARPNSFNNFLLKENTKTSRDSLVRVLNKWGYNKNKKTFCPKTFSVRGCIVDVFPITSRYPVRVEFFDDRIESIRRFNPTSQRTITRTKETTLLPPIQINKKFISMFDLTDKNTKKLFVKSKNNLFSITENDPSSNTEKIICSLIEKNKIRSFLKETTHYKKIFVFCNNRKQIKKVKNILPPSATLVSGNIPSSIVLPKHRLCFLSFSCLSGSSPEITSRWETGYGPGTYGQGEEARLKDLVPGDFLTHKNFGVGQYQGLKIITAKEKKQECLKITYSDNGVLYLPTEHLTMIYKYQHNGEGSVRMSTLGKSGWLRQKRRAKQMAKGVIKELIKTQTLRSLPRGFVYGHNDDLYKTLKESFPYKETPDQKNAILNVVQDMEKETPVDRLICGDVGYGKTEVALRAIIKSVSSNKTVLFLAPTTLLADQHYILSKERLGPLGVEIELLSRFKTKTEQKKIIEKLSNGFIDLLVGTHRLLSPDVIVPRLGLLIVDEEQRFGVRHKEIIKKTRPNIDIITLSATPIPRTLQQSLVGIKNISKIQTPPKLRKPIETIVSYFNWEAVRFSVEREISRSGQIYFLHNDIDSMPFFHEKLSLFFPLLSIGIAHGKMKTKDLEPTVLSFFAGDIDILLCTTIIESGLDVANANTIIINNAQNFGLSQLYQIRGRVGRSPKQAYSLLFVPAGLSINTTAFKRLKAMETYTQLGSGYDIAKKDLELRGAGSMFGYEQSGHLSFIGFEMYCDLLKEASDEALGKHEGKKKAPSVHFGGHSLLSSEYVPAEDDRLYFYQRLSEAENTSQIKDILSELKDRFGRLPGPASSLFRVAQMRVSLVGSSVQTLKITSSLCSVVLCSFFPFSSVKSIKEKISAKKPSSKIKEKDGDIIISVSVSNISASLKTARYFINLFRV